MADLGNTAVISPTDGSNNSGTVPTWAEGQAPSQVNDSARALQGAVAREWENRSYPTSTGTAPAFVVTYTVAPAALRSGQTYTFTAHAAAVGTDTLNANALGAKGIKKVVAGVKTATAANDFYTNDKIACVYDGTDMVWENFAANSVLLAGANAFTGNNTFAGDSTFNNLVNITEDFRLSGDLSPAQITANQTDYAPTGHGTTFRFRIDIDADRTIFSLAGGAAGRLIAIRNITTGFVLTIPHDDGATGTASMRFICPGGQNLKLESRGEVLCQYDGTTSRWVVLKTNSQAGQTAMEAAATDAQYVTPANQHYHPAEPKCWGEFLANSTTILKSYNITSVADTALGQMTVTIATDFSDANWACLITRAEDDLTLVYSATYSAKAAGTVILNSVVEAGGASDPTAASGNASWSFLGLGDL